MSSLETHKAFTGSIPKIYETYLVPLIFESYADDIAARLKAFPATRVLEIAAGTGVVTRAMASALPAQTSIVATGLNQAMLDHAMQIGTRRPVEWRQADATALPFDDDAFDVVACQFGVMFFPDRPKAYSEVRRVLKPGGTLLFNVGTRSTTTNSPRACMLPPNRCSRPTRRNSCCEPRTVISTRTASAAISRKAGSRIEPTSRSLPREAARHRHAFRRWGSATAHRCAAKSRPAILHASAMSSMRPPRRLPGASVRMRSTARCRRTS